MEIRKNKAVDIERHNAFRETIAGILHRAEYKTLIETITDCVAERTAKRLRQRIGEKYDYAFNVIKSSDGLIKRSIESIVNAIYATDKNNSDAIVSSALVDLRKVLSRYEACLEIYKGGGAFWDYEFVDGVNYQTFPQTFEKEAK